MANRLKGKKIVLGITGSIAAYKACYLIRGLIKRGAEVQVVITPAGKEFITPLTLSTLTGKPVISEFFDRRDGSWNSHVDLGLWADVYLSAKAPVFVAPAMDLDMYAHPATQKNLDILRSYGNHIIEPGTGELASHLVGKGRMEEPDAIIQYLENYFTAVDGDLVGKKILITAGPTYEKIDPVRFIGNYSSGKMGFALADECASRGAEVFLVAGPVQLSAGHPGIRRVNVESAAEMYEAVMGEMGQHDIVVSCAAVADFKPVRCEGAKVKRGKAHWTLELEPTADIAEELGKRKREGQLLVGFALETNDEVCNALQKLHKKNLDLIVLNSLRNANTCFGYDTNMVTLIDRNERQTQYELKSKREVAEDIVERVVALAEGDSAPAGKE